jgi:ketosteroid isomerase-like protein
MRIQRKKNAPADDLYAINSAKTEFREGFNQGDACRIMGIAHPDLVNFSDGQPSEFGESGLDSLKRRLEKLFADYTAQLSVIVIEIRLCSDVAHGYGWHDLTLTPRLGGEAIRRRYRYVDIWRKNDAREWKLWMYVDNLDVADPFVPELQETPKPKA